MFHAYIFALLISISSYSQTHQIYQNDTINKRDENGLKIGRWISFNYYSEAIEQVIDNDAWIFTEGFYKVIELKDSVKLDSYKHYSKGDLYFKKNEYTYYCSGRHNNQYSVRDGYWIAYSTNNKNKIIRIDLYKEGIQLQSKYFENGSLSMEKYDRLFDGGKVQDTYKNANSFKYKRDFWAKTDSELNKELYYPDSPLNIIDCEINFSTTLSQTDTATIKIISNSEKEIIVDSIFCSDNQIVPLTNEILITPKDTFDLRVLYCPDRYNLRGNDTLSLFTTSIFPFRYDIQFNLHAYDLAYWNAKKIEEIELTRGIDKSLIFYVCDLGWHSWIEISTDTGEFVEKFFLREAGCKNLDLSEYKLGTYKIHVETGDEKTYDYKLRIK
jgi:hypothetical protein